MPDTRTHEQMMAGAANPSQPYQPPRVRGIAGILGRIGERGRARQAARQAQRGGGITGQGTVTAEERLEPVAEGVEELEAAGEEHLAGETGVIAANKAEAEAAEREMERGREVGKEKFDEASAAAEAGLTDIQEEIDTTRAAVDAMPDKVRAEFDAREIKLDAELERARTGLAGKEESALANIMSGQASTTDAAVAGIHGATRQQIADIDAQVQQGTLSPSQAAAMKSRIKMGASMQLSAAVGQTIHAFVQTEAQTAASFGNMFTQFESAATQVQGQFGAQAAGAFSQTVQASGQLNAALTGMDAQATASRDAMLSQNAGARGAFVNAGDANSITMMDYTQDTYVSPIPMAINNLTARTDYAHDLIRSDEWEKSFGLLEQHMDEVERENFRQRVFGFLELIS